MLDTPVLAWTNGSDHDFRLLYDDHSRGVYGLASSLCGSRLAADITQEVFVTFWRHPQRFDPRKGTLHSLLLTMAHHISIDLLRSEEIRRAREAKSGFPEISNPEPEEGALSDERSAKLIEALGRLPDICREVIEIAFYGQCTYREVATLLEIPEGTAKARIRRGMTLLRSDLWEELSNQVSTEPRTDLSSQLPVEGQTKPARNVPTSTLPVP